MMWNLSQSLKCRNYFIKPRIIKILISYMLRYNLLYMIQEFLESVLIRLLVSRMTQFLISYACTLYMYFQIHLLNWSWAYFFINNWYMLIMSFPAVSFMVGKKLQHIVPEIFKVSLISLSSAFQCIVPSDLSCREPHSFYPGHLKGTGYLQKLSSHAEFLL